jgi:hypothetical protein
VETETGKPVEIRIDKEMKAPATVKVARNRMAYHLVKIHPGQAAVAGYLLANKCMNILRMKPLHSEDRVVPASGSRNFDAAEIAINKSLGSAQSVPQSLVEYMVGGVVSQLNNLPVQLRIERWIRQNLPEIASEQRRFLEQDMAQTVAGVSAEIERVTPPIIFATSNAMTYAYARGIGTLLGTNFVQRYNNHQQIVRQGKKLYEMVDSDDDGMHRGDVFVIDRWAEALGIRDWYSWLDFESVPESYYADVQ